MYVLQNNPFTTGGLSDVLHDEHLSKNCKYRQLLISYLRAILRNMENLINLTLQGLMACNFWSLNQLVPKAHLQVSCSQVPKRKRLFGSGP